MASPVFRTTTYQLGDADFSGATAKIHLRYELSANYFVMIHWGAVDSSSTAPDNHGARVTADPFGTGDLSQSSGNWLEITRAAFDEGSCVGTVTVVECLRASETAGFRLLSVKSVNHPTWASTATQSGSASSAVAWGAFDKVVLFGGYRGGGTSTTGGTGTTDHPTLGLRWYPSGTDTINWERKGPTSSSVDEADSTVYVVEWGTEWEIQRVIVSGSTGGDYSNSANYTLGYPSRAFAPAKSWVWFTGWADGNNSGDSYLSLCAVPGSGGSTSPGASESTVAVTLGVSAVSWYADVYVLSHPLLGSEWQYQVLGDGGSRTKDFTVSTPDGWEKRASADALFLASTAGGRIAGFCGGFNSTSSTRVNECAFSARPTGATTVTVSRASPSPFLAWAGWLQTTDFGLVTTGTGKEAVFRSTQIQIQGHWWGTSTYDLVLPNNLAENYFVIIEGVRGDASGDPPTAYARVTADPFGTGDLAVSSGANVIQLTRESSTGGWYGVVTVVECLRSFDAAGFRLRSVTSCAGSAGSDVGVDTQFFTVAAGNGAVRNRSKTTVFAGPRGGGATSATAAATDSNAVYVAGVLSADGRIALQRYSNTTASLDAYTATAYVIEWGSEWTVGATLYTGFASSTWTQFDLVEPVVAEDTFVLAFGGAYDNEPNDGPMSVTVVLGDGSTPPSGTMTRGAVRCGISESVNLVVYTMSHPSLSVQWNTVSMAGGVYSTSAAISGPVRGESRGYTPVWANFVLGYRWSACWTYTNESTGGLIAETTPWSWLASQTSVSVTRALDNLNTIDGWVMVVDAGGIEARTTGSGFDDDSGAYGPVQGLVIRNRWLDAATLTATEEGGPGPGPVVPDDANNGSIYGFAEGVPDTTAASWVAGYEKEIVLDVVSGGGLGGSAGFGRRLQGQAASKTAGLNALPTLFRHAGPDGNSNWHAGSIVYSSKYNRLIVARVSSTTTVDLWMLDLNDNPLDTANYTLVQVTVENADDGSSHPYTYVQDVGLGLVELADGSLMMMVNTNSESLVDADAYLSTDGGSTWIRVHRNLRSAVTGSASFSRGAFTMSSSGDYVRILFSTASWFRSGGQQIEIETWVSTDRGASWTETNNIPMSRVGGLGAVSAPGRAPIAMCGVGDQSGTFLLVVSADSAINVYIATGSGDWSAYPSLDINYSSVAVGPPYACWLVRDPDRIWLWAVSSNGSTSARWSAYVIDPSDVTDAANWDRWDDSTDGMGTFDGAPDFLPYNTVGLWAGEMMVLFGTLADVSDTTAPNIKVGCCLLFAGQWDQHPWSFTKDVSPQWRTNWLSSTLPTMTRCWYAWTGDPVNAGGSLWTYSGTATRTIRGDYVQASASSSISGYWRLNDGALGGTKWTNGAMHFATQVTSQRVGTSTAATHMGIRLIGYGTYDYDVTIRMTTTGFLIYDNIAAATRHDGSSAWSSSSGALVEWRVTWNVSANQMEVQYRVLTGGAKSDADWTTVGPVSVTASGVSAGQEIHVGILAAGGSSGTSTFRFYEWVENHDDKCGQNASQLSYPDDMMGAPMTAGGIHVANGVTVRWGGSGAFGADGYVAKIDYSRGVENLLLDSPRLMWESTTLDEVPIVLQAGTSTSLTGARWEVDTVLLVGTVDRTAAIEFSEENTTAAWASPAESVEVSADLYTDLTVVDVDGSAVKLEAASGILPPIGEAVDLYIRFVGAGSASGHTHRLLQDPDAGAGWYQLAGEASAEGVYAIGSSAVVFMDRMIYRGSGFHRYKYARIVFPDVSSVGNVTDVDGTRAGGTASGTHRLGTILLGSWVPFDVPIDWTFTDNQQPNVTEQRTKGGASWAQKEGPHQRTVTGRIVGDVDEFRRKLRRMLGKYADFNRAPSGLVLDGRNLNPDTLMLVRWQSGSQQDEAAWYQDENGVWRTAGDVDLVCVEVV